MKFYTQTALIALLFTLLCTGVRAQTVISVMDFDGTTPEMMIATDVAFFDLPGGDGFFGVHDANGDNTDGTPADTGDGNASDVGAVDQAPISGDFLFVNDLNNVPPGEDDNVGTDGFAIITFGPVSVSGQVDLLFEFDYSINGFDGTDEVRYELFIDGVGQGEVDLVSGNGLLEDKVSLPIPDGTSSVSLELRVQQNGGSDQAGFDNFIVTADNPTDPCGITNFGPAETNCTSSTAGADNDTYEVTVPFAGADADASLVVEVGGSPVTFTIASGDLAAGTSPLVIQSADFLEGTAFSIALTDTGGDCATATPATGSVTSNECNPSCDISILTENVTFFCESLTDEIDNITVDIDYSGSDDGVNVTITGLVNGVVFSETDLFNDSDGRVQATGIPEGDTYTVVVSGSGCDRMFTLPIPAGVCAGSDIIINEVLYDGLTATDQTNLGIPAFEDPNRDNSFNGGEDEFVEITNIGSGTIDIGGYTLSDQNNADIITVPVGTMLAPGEYFVFFGGGIPDLPCGTVTREAQSPGSAFLGLNNSSAEQVIIKDGTGTVVAQMNYVGMGNVNESLALSPNADPAGTFVAQTSIIAPTRYSPCFDNDDNSLPIELLAFSADARAKYVMLNWETINEVTNDRFAVERSDNGRVWERIGTVVATGREANIYEFKDENPLSGQNIYRLRQYDLDGTYALYGPVMAEFAAVAGIYPNPVENELFLRGFGTDNRVLLLDASGKLLRELSAGSDRADVANLRPGAYMLRVLGSKGSEVLRFVKQ